MVDIFEKAQIKYLEANELIENSKGDPPTEPYKSKYKASEILQTIENELEECDKASEEFRVSVLCSLVNYKLGFIACDTEDLTNGEKYLLKSWENLQESSLKPECILLSVTVLNQLGILWSERNEPKKACDYLKTAEVIYGEYKLGKNPPPCSFIDLFKNSNESRKDNWILLEKELTLTLYFLAQVYEHLEDSESSAKYCHITLKRQLDYNEYDPLDWCLNCAMLSQYFLSKQSLCTARHVLACSNYIFAKNEQNLSNGTIESSAEYLERLRRCKADTHRCWAKYAIFLMVLSQDKMLKDLKDGVENLSLDDHTDEVIQTYRLIKESELKTLENRISCETFTSFEEARSAFLFGVECLCESKKYYILSDHAFDYAQIIQDNSKLYKHLAFFEGDTDRKCKMHKRRIDLLEDVLKKLNPQYYLAVCRQLMFELAEIYSEMMDLKMKAGDSDNNSLTPHAVKKINYLIIKAIENYRILVFFLE